MENGQEAIAEAEMEGGLAAVEAAWIWTLGRYQAVFGGGWATLPARTEQPCQPIDIMSQVQRLYSRRMLTPEHLWAMGRWGRKRRRPDGETRGAVEAKRLWAEAMTLLDRALRAKGLLP